MLKHLPKQFLRWLPAFLIALTGHVQAQALWSLRLRAWKASCGSIPPASGSLRPRLQPLLHREPGERHGWLRASRAQSLTRSSTPRCHVSFQFLQLRNLKLQLGALLRPVCPNLSLTAPIAIFSNSTSAWQYISSVPCFCTWLNNHLLWHMTNLRNYVNFSLDNVPPVKLGRVTLQPLRQGTGMLGLPVTSRRPRVSCARLRSAYRCCRRRPAMTRCWNCFTS